MKNRNVLFITLFCFSFVILFSSLIALSTYIEKKAIAASAALSGRQTVIVDAGHGGEDGGAVGADGTEESMINLDIALKLEKLLEFYGYDVIMTRTDDVMTCDDGLTTIKSKKVSDIHNRFKIIENNPQAIFVSIHQNKFHDPSQNGAQVFYSKNNPQSKVLADTIQKSIVSQLQVNNKRITKKSGTEIYLLYHSQIPSVLVECGFVSNYAELLKLKDEKYRLKMAVLIADGIIKYNQTG